MSRYEIMLVADGTMSLQEARQGISNLLDLFNKLENYQESIVESDKLAYPIKKKDVCHRFILNFDLDDVKVIHTFNRLVNINKCLLRHLIINESKDRGWRARNNPKKVKDYLFRQEKYKQWLEKKRQFNQQNTGVNVQNQNNNAA